MTQLLEMPCSPEAERAVLSCMMMDPGEAIHEAKSRLTPEHFYKPHHRTIFEALCGMRVIPLTGPIDLVMLADELTKSGELDEVGGIATLAEIFDDAPSTAIMGEYQRVLERDWKRRTMFFKANQRAREARESTNEDEVESAIRAMQRDCDEILISSSANEYTNMPPALCDMIAEIEERRESGGKIPGIETGIEHLDRLTNGYQAGQQWVIGARPSVGKSAMLLTLAANLAKSGVSCGFFSAEMTRAQLLKRMTAGEARIDSRALDRGQMQPIELNRMQKAIREMMRWPLHIADRRGITSAEIVRQARQMVKRDGAKVIFVDYLQKIKPPQKLEKRHLDVGAVSNDLFNLAGDLGICTVVAAQLARPIKATKVPAPTMADLRESGDIEQDADVVALLHRLDDEDNPNADTVDVDMILDKVRNGATGRVEMTFYKPTTKFEVR